MKITLIIKVYLLISILFLTGLGQSCCIIETTSDNSLKVYFIDVGQGDAILIDRGTTEVLIDGGSDSSGALTFLKPHVDGTLEVVIATHAHADHIAGLTKILEYYPVGEIWLSGDAGTSKTYNTFMDAVNSEGAKVNTGTPGNTISVGNLSFIIMHPGSLTGSSNNNSLVL